MKLTTRCPHCQTVFETSLADLQLRKGYVRCVQCAHIFDGYAEVTTDASAGAAGPGSRAVEPSMGVHAVHRRAQAAGPVRDVQHDIPIIVEHDAHDDPMFVDVPEPSLALGPDADADEEEAPHVFRNVREPSMRARPEAFIVEARSGHGGHGGTASALLASHRRREGAGNPWRVLGLGALIVLLLLLAAQAAYVWRAQLAQAVPVLRPWLERACDTLQCEVPYARNLTRAAIMSSSLKRVESRPAPRPDEKPGSTHNTAAAPDGPAGAEGDRHEYLLSVMLRNGTDRPQAWPVLVLTLNDGAGAPVVRRNLEPENYLPAALQSTPFPAHDNVHLELPLTVEGAQINGFQLDLFYP